MLDNYERLLRFVEFIARDYVELSHDKVRLQRDDYIRRARKLLEELYEEEEDTSMLTLKVYVYPDGEVYVEPPSWRSDDYEVREAPYCVDCDLFMDPHYGEPFASCSCKTIEWHR